MQGTAVAAPLAQLWLDDELIAEETAPVTGTDLNKLTFTINHPYSNATFADQSVDYSLKRGLLLTRVDALNKTASSTWYDDGTLRSKTDRNNQTIQYTYTATGKPATISYPDGSVNSYTYDLRDNLIKRQDGTRITTLGYDAVGRITSMINPHGYATGYQYDAAGNMTKITYPGDKSVSYTYDALNRLKTVTIDWLGKTASYQYDDAGRMTGLTQFNNTVTGYDYDNANRLTDLENLSSGGGAVIADYHFTLDGNGNRINSSQTTPLATSTANADLNLTYNPSKTRLVTAGTNSFTYDHEGRLATGYGKTYNFDYEHRLIGVNGGGHSETFSYDGAGNRLRVIRNGVATRYIYDLNGNLIAEVDGSNGIITRYFIHGAGLMAMVTSENALYCYHFDATGHTVALTDAGKTVVNKYAYTPFGVITGQTEAIPQPFKYAGQHGVMAESNGLYYMRARYYDPAVKRFISEDPLGFDGGDLNLYAYVGNNPVMGVDPWGLHRLAGTMPGTPTVMSCHPSENGTAGQLSFTPGQSNALKTTAYGASAITAGLITKDPFKTGVGISLMAEGLTLSAIEFGFAGDTSNFPSPYAVIDSISAGINQAYASDTSNYPFSSSSNSIIHNISPSIYQAYSNNNGK